MESVKELIYSYMDVKEYQVQVIFKKTCRSIIKIDYSFKIFRFKEIRFK